MFGFINRENMKISELAPSPDLRVWKTPFADSSYVQVRRLPGQNVSSSIIHHTLSALVIHYVLLLHCLA